MRAQRLVLVVFGAALLTAAPVLAESKQFEDEQAEPQYEDDEGYEDEEAGGVNGILDLPIWRDFTARIQRQVDAEGLLRARRWGNIVNGILLGITGPVALAVSTFGLKLSNVVLSLYVTGFGGLLAGLELGLAPVAPWVAKNLSYLTTGNGRTALLVFAGNLVWAFGKTGLVPALITCINAVFNANFNSILSFVQADDDVVRMEEDDARVSRSGLGSSPGASSPPSSAAAEAEGAVSEDEEATGAQEEALARLREQLEAARIEEEVAAAMKQGGREEMQEESLGEMQEEPLDEMVAKEELPPATEEEA